MLSYESTKPEITAVTAPDLNTLLDKMICVHATRWLPEEGAVIAGCRNVDPDSRYAADEEHPSFRPTLHFALGGLVQPHGLSSWEDAPYALLAPLGAITDRLVNLSAQDSFTLGNLPLTSAMAMVVPKGTDTSRLPEGMRVYEYQPVSKYAPAQTDRARPNNLRDAINAAILSEEGWVLDSQPESVANGCKVLLGDTDINTPSFFRSVLEAYPSLSFGTHVAAKRGEAFRFGVIDQLINRLMSEYRESGPFSHPDDLRLQRAVVSHNLQILDAIISHDQRIPPDSKEVFSQKVNKTLGWLNIVNADLRVRQEHSKTFNRADDRTLSSIFPYRNSADALSAVITTTLDQLPAEKATDREDITIYASALCSVSTDEFEYFMQTHAGFFEDATSIATVRTNYAAMRKTLLGADHPEQIILTNMIQRYIRDMDKKNDPLSILKDTFDARSNQLGAALALFEIPEMRNHLQSIGYTFDADHIPQTLQEFLKVHPRTRILFEGNSPKTTSPEITSVLVDLGLAYFIKKDEDIATMSLRSASHSASKAQWLQEIQEQQEATAQTPLRDTRPIEELMVGDYLNLYQLMKRDHDLETMWDRIGLAKTYRKMFPTDVEFWDSGLSLLEVHTQLLQLARQSSTSSS